MRVLVYEFLSAHAPPEAQADLLAQGRSMRDAIVADLLGLEEVRVTCATAGADRPFASPRLTYATPDPALDPVAFVRAQAAAHDYVWAVAPETDGLLEAFARAVPAAQWLGCAPEAIAIAASKRATAARLQAAGIAVAPCLADTDDSDARRWVVKPDDGAGACDTVVHGTLAAARADCARRAARGLRAVLQPWIEGDALSLSLLARAGGVDVLSLNRQRIEIDAAGRVAYRGVQIDVAPPGAALRRLAQDVARALPGLRGFVGLDVVAAAHGPVLIEVNPRPTCAYVGLSRALGRNLARDVLAAHRSESA
jgi:predicted ATP-grasp superfamily ATP-dependent carboligase